MIEVLFQYAFMRNAMITAVLSSIICGIIGTITVEKKLVSMSGGIAHTSFGGIGLGYFLGIEPLIGGLLFSLGASAGIAKINRSTNENADTLIGMFWAVGMAIGVVFIALTPGYPPDMNTYLFGDILTVSNIYVTIIAMLTVGLILVVGGIFQYWKGYLFDDEYMKVLGVPTLCLEYLLYLLLALTIVLLIKVVGIVLVIALLTIPSAASKFFFEDLKKIMIGASVYALIASMGGISISYYLNIPSGATIILFAMLGYSILYLARKITSR